MLIDKYLPTYDYKHFHSTKINASPIDAYERMLHCDLSRSFLIKLFSRLRGIRNKLNTLEYLRTLGFIKLDEHPGHEVVYGIITSSPTFTSCQPFLSPAYFTQQTDSNIIKAVINFRVHDEYGTKHTISTETRVLCCSRKIRSKFRWYWFFVKPFSQLLRRAMLHQLRKQISTPYIHEAGMKK